MSRCIPPGPSYQGGFLEDEGAQALETGFYAFPRGFGVRVGPFKRAADAAKVVYPECGAGCCASAMSPTIRYLKPVPEFAVMQ